MFFRPARRALFCCAAFVLVALPAAGPSGATTSAATLTLSGGVGPPVGLGQPGPSGGAAMASGQYTVTSLGTLGGSFCSGYRGQNSFATALNAVGQVAGGSCKPSGPFDQKIGAFFWSNGVITD